VTDLRDAAQNARAWPFEAARAILDRVGGTVPDKGYVLFETGYGPSGLPHIGTFGEVARTTMVRRAFELLSDIPTRLLCFSDDMTGCARFPTMCRIPMRCAPICNGRSRTCPTRSASMRASARTTTQGCVPFSTGSASITNSSRPPSSIAPGASTRFCAAPPNAMTI
jgi:hypothetical protein